jgi:hypothetical protein
MQAIFTLLALPILPNPVTLLNLLTLLGPAAVLASKCIKKVEVLEYPELGMEAVWKIEVEDFPGTHTYTNLHRDTHTCT